MTRPTSSAARQWPLIARFAEAEERLALAAVARGPVPAGVYEFLRFGVKQAWACLFGGAMVALLIATHLWYPKGAAVARYDFLVLAAVGLQAALITLRLETIEEAKVILVFHIVGTAMEVFKTAVGSWIYPEASVLRIAGVPLFTGFMYAAVGSYLARAWRLFDLRFDRHPPTAHVFALAVAIYINFFAHHYVFDMRVVLFAAAAVLFGRTRVRFRVWRAWRSMPLLLAFVLIAAFIWIAENVGTVTGAWLYPMQARAWSIVPLAKLGSWFLLMLVSYALVCLVNTPTAADDVESTRDRLYGGLGAGPILDRGNLDPGLAAREARVGTVRRDGNRDR
jgi:uncharacterized membrane protein YoaT (DUF817 family)